MSTRMDGFTIKLGPEVYMIIAPDGTEGALTDYGETAAIRVGGATYICHMDVPSDPAGVGMVTAIVPQVTYTEEDPDLEADDYDDDGNDGNDDDDSEDNGEDDGEDNGEGDDGEPLDTNDSEEEEQVA